MELKQLLDFIELEDKRLQKTYNYPDEQKRILARTVKVTEELGELSSEILASNSLQRKHKIDSHTREKLHEEVADVLITTLLLAKSLNVDVEKELEQKIDKIHKRHEEAE
ncbi:MAG: MazG-like family protein [Candidatus Nanoarchaeia archaeon]|jgi:NTP pyrophosphatase (non-canonical NTP hydrolase)